MEERVIAVNRIYKTFWFGEREEAAVRKVAVFENVKFLQHSVILKILFFFVEKC